MRLRYLVLSTVLATAACDSALEVDPTTVVPEESAIIDAVSARAALAGMYDALQDGSYYGVDMFAFLETSSDNAAHTGTFTAWGDADQAVLTSDNGEVEGMWGAMFDAINRANVIIQKLEADDIPGLTDPEENQFIGEALFVRALSYHNLVKLFGGVPIVTEPTTDLTAAANISRATTTDTYAQILADLSAAEALMTNATGTRVASLGAVRALRARVQLYRASSGPTGLGDASAWASAEAAATSVEAMGYSLEPVFANLFTDNGADTDEDIFRLRFNDQDASSTGFYYIVKTLGGRYEVGVHSSINAAMDPADGRRSVTIVADPGNASRLYTGKFPSPIGTDHSHVIRFGEVLLIRAEARARQGNLVGAVSDYNQLRTRAGLAPHVIGVDVITQADVLAAIARERRSELAFEGDRWPDLVRSGAAVTAMSAVVNSFPGDGCNQVLYPVPQSEIDVTADANGNPRLTQNCDY